VDPDTKHRKTSVVDPDLCVFGPPGSGSVIVCADPDLDLDQDPSLNKHKPTKL
jgi:hypothetical protein